MGFFADPVTQKLLHKKSLTSVFGFFCRPCNTEALTQKKPLRKGAFTQRQVYTEDSEAFRQESLYTQKLLLRSFYKEKSLHKEVLTQRRLYTQRLLHRDAFYTAAFSQRSFYTEELLHREACILRGFDAEKFFTQRSFYTNKSFTQRSLYRQKLVRKETFTNRNFYTQRTFYKEAFAHRSLAFTQKYNWLTRRSFRSFYAKKLLHAETFTHRSFYTQKFLTKKPFHRGTFTQRNLCAQTRLHTGAFAHRSFCTRKSLPIFHQVSFFMIIHHLSPSYLCFHALLVHSLRRLVFMSHGVLSVHASSSFPLRRSKLNENPRINSI